jgi:hypothetical protein
MYGFPPPDTLPDLRWLGPDYAAALARDLVEGLLRQDPGSRVMGVRCAGQPDLRASVDPAGVIRAHDASFTLQILVRDGALRSWRLRGSWTYSGRDLGTPIASVRHFWRLLSAESI